MEKKLVLYKDKEMTVSIRKEGDPGEAGGNVVVIENHFNQNKDTLITVATLGEGFAICCLENMEIVGARQHKDGYVVVPKR